MSPKFLIIGRFGRLEDFNYVCYIIFFSTAFYVVAFPVMMISMMVEIVVAAETILSTVLFAVFFYETIILS